MNTPEEPKPEERVESKAAAFKSAMDRLVQRLSSDFLGLR